MFSMADIIPKRPDGRHGRKEKRMNEKDDEYAAAGCVAIMALFGKIAIIATNLWLMWRICRAVEAILAK